MLSNPTNTQPSSGEPPGPPPAKPSSDPISQKTIWLVVREAVNSTTSGNTRTIHYNASPTPPSQVLFAYRDRDKAVQALDAFVANSPGMERTEIAPSRGLENSGGEYWEVRVDGVADGRVWIEMVVLRD
jgi:hypothetical protein